MGGEAVVSSALIAVLYGVRPRRWLSELLKPRAFVRSERAVEEYTWDVLIHLLEIASRSGRQTDGFDASRMARSRRSRLGAIENHNTLSEFGTVFSVPLPCISLREPVLVSFPMYKDSSDLQLGQASHRHEMARFRCTSRRRRDHSTCTLSLGLNS